MTLSSPVPSPRRNGPRLALLIVALVVVAGALALMRRPRSATLPVSPKAATRKTSPAPSPSSIPSTTAAREPSRPAGAPRPAPLRVEADVADAAVFVDRRFVGTAPVDVRDLEPGTHRLNVSAEGHDMYTEEVDVGRQPKTVSVRFTEVRLDESIGVVHKHGLGGCRGVLRARPEGLAFEAAEGKDSFDTALDTLDRFEVDYLKKTLRVSFRGGRGYTFTVEGRSADPLLVFQQRVDKARQRLRSS